MSRERRGRAYLRDVMRAVLRLQDVLSEARSSDGYDDREEVAAALDALMEALETLMRTLDAPR